MQLKTLSKQVNETLILEFTLKQQRAQIVYNSRALCCLGLQMELVYSYIRASQLTKFSQDLEILPKVKLTKFQQVAAVELR